MKYEKIRKQVLEAILEAVDLGLIKGTSGNVAVQDETEDVIAISPSGVAYKTMKAEDIAIVDMNGKWIDGPFKPSSETPMHTAVLRARKDVKATVHTHGMYATIMAMQDGELQPTTPPQAEFVPVQVVPFVMPGSTDLAETVVNTLGDGRAVLLTNHGMLCCGKTIKDAMAATIYTEEMATTAYYAKLLGNFKSLPEEAIKKMQELIAADKAV
jgi:L-fuculose-phosphate aldolase